MQSSSSYQLSTPSECLCRTLTQKRTGQDRLATMDTLDVLFTVDKGDTCRIGLPPKDATDDFHTRAIQFGTFENASQIFFGPDDKIYAVRGAELYQGSLPRSKGADWFSEAKLIGESGWDQFKFVLFHPKGRIYAVTHEGHLFKGVPPTPDDQSWIDRKAKRLDGERWNEFSALCYDPVGMLYGVASGKLVRGLYPSSTTRSWLDNAEEIGNSTSWEVLSHFMAFTQDGNLWCVNKSTGEMLTGPPPTNSTENWADSAQKLGSGFHVYKHLSLMRDTTLNTIKNLNFLVSIGETSDQQVVEVKEQQYDNKGGSAGLSCTLDLDTSYTEHYSFSKEHGFEAGEGADPTFTTGMPTIAEDGCSIFIKKNIRHKWNITEINEIQKPFRLSMPFEVPPGKAVTLKATLQKATIEVPYMAKVCTMIGNNSTISGTLTGVCYYNLQLEQAEE
ncbi:uncharacterized protein LOC144817781 isoform X2 [Lissotriton helveticus]